MNKIILMGNLTKDPEMFELPDGSTYTNYSLAVNREYGDEGADFFNCTSFGKVGENLYKYVKKGQKILVEGRVKQTTKEKDGSKKTFWNIIVPHWEFTGKANNNSDEEEAEEPVKSQKEDSQSYGPAQDDLPF